MDGLEGVVARWPFCPLVEPEKEVMTYKMEELRDA